MIACLIASFRQKATVTLQVRMLPVPGGDKEWRFSAARAGLPFGVASPRRFVSLSTIAFR